VQGKGSGSSGTYGGKGGDWFQGRKERAKEGMGDMEGKK